MPPTPRFAVLDRTLLLDAGVVAVPRHHAVVLPEGTTQIAVVRIETGQRFGRFSGSSAVRRDAVTQLLAVARQPGIAALQIDFDARRSERAFYRALLEDLRRQMPANLPLTITALVSWCSEDDWIATLPIDDATPMFFRMEPGRARLARTSTISTSLPEPLCGSSAGVSTREPWPTSLDGRRIFVFPDRGWRNDLQLLTAPEHLP